MSVSKKNSPVKPQADEPKKIVPQLVERAPLPKPQAEILIPDGKVLIYNLDEQGKETSWFFYSESTAHRFYGDKSRFLIKKKEVTNSGDFVTVITNAATYEVIDRTSKRISARIGTAGCSSCGR